MKMNPYFYDLTHFKGKGRNTKICIRVVRIIRVVRVFNNIRDISKNCAKRTNNSKSIFGIKIKMKRQIIPKVQNVILAVMAQM